MAALAGCATPISEGRYDDFRTRMRESAVARNANIAKCARLLDRDPLAGRIADARTLNVPLKRLGKTVCTRLMKGIMSGRISRKNVNDYLTNRDRESIHSVILDG
jgi:hypothetical protein